MHDKFAIVTGSGGSIGGAIVERLLAQDYFVLGLDLADSRSHPSFNFIEVDMAHPERIDALFEGAIVLGRHNVLVNAAGVREIVPMPALSLDEWNRVLAINLTAPFVLSRRLAVEAVEQYRQAVIVNIASVSGMLGEPERTAYVSSKHGLIGLTKQLAIEFGHAGIRANSVSPGVTRSNMTRAYFDDPQQMALIKSGLYLDRVGEPEDVASLVSFLASEDAGYITGSNFTVDGGWTAGKNL